MAERRKAARRSTSAGQPKRPAQPSARRALSIATDAKKTVEQRVAAMAEAPLAVCENDANLQAMLKVLRDNEEPLEVRLAALQALQAASFSVVAFEACRGDYIASLRAVAEDANPELRQRVLGMLAREKDGFAQQKLLEGLQDPDKALVPPEKALQLLSYDVHADAYPVARAIVSQPPNATAKREALRLLAADASAAPLFEKVLRDKDEAPELRQLSATVLQTTQPARLQAHAREMLLDASEQDEIQAVSLTALAQFGNDAALNNDEALLNRVDQLRGGESTLVQQSARQFLSKYGR
jgi:hypothetical protein